jgi:hypothetical protein
MAASSFRQYPFVAWERLKPAIRWPQGQHVFCCGATGTGKSTVAEEFLSRREQVVVCVSKGMDPIFDDAYYSTYTRITKWPPRRNDGPKVLLWPTNMSTLRETKLHKTQVFQHMFDDVLLERGNWCIDIDETHYMSDTLHLSGEITDHLEQGRSAGISLWNNTQRPSGIPLSVYVNSAHAFLFQAQEEYDVARLARLGGRHTTAKEMAYNLDLLESIDTHELIYLDRSGRIPPVRSIVMKGRKSGTQKR